MGVHPVNPVKSFFSFLQPPGASWLKGDLSIDTLQGCSPLPGAVLDAGLGPDLFTRDLLNTQLAGPKPASGRPHVSEGTDLIRILKPGGEDSQQPEHTVVEFVRADKSCFA